MAIEISEDTPNFSFPFPTYEDWLSNAQQELAGAEPMERLTVRKGEIEILPFYDTSKNNPSQKPLLKPSLNPFNGPRSWINSPRILVTNDIQANKVALSYLNSGAEGILFDCHHEINPTLLLDKISLVDCSVSFVIRHAAHEWIFKFIEYAENNFDKSLIKGGIYWSHPAEYTIQVAQAFSHWPQFYSFGIIVDTADEVTNEIAGALHHAVNCLDVLAKELTDVQTILPQISFSLSISNDFFLEIAKLKSLRKLWYQINGAYPVSGTKPLHIHARSVAWIDESFQPHGNMIKSTSAAMAAIAGGCDSLTVEPEDHHHDTMNRIALNVSTLLKEESHFSKVADPTAGSYYLDALTNQLAEKAWSKFQQLVK